MTSGLFMHKGILCGKTENEKRGFFFDTNHGKCNLSTLKWNNLATRRYFRNLRVEGKSRDLI